MKGFRERDRDISMSLIGDNTLATVVNDGRLELPHHEWHDSLVLGTK